MVDCYSPAERASVKEPEDAADLEKPCRACLGCPESAQIAYYARQQPSDPGKASALAVNTATRLVFKRWTQPNCFANDQ